MDEQTNPQPGTPHEIGRRIDASFGEGPSGAPVDDVLRQGRSALRRRRVATWGGAAAVLAVVGVGAAVAGTSLGGGSGDDLVADGPRSSASSPPSTEPSTEPSDEPDVPTFSSDAPASWSAGQLAGYVDGEVVVREGLRVTEVAEDPLALEPAVRSTALALEETDGKRSWRYLLWDDGRTPRFAQESSTVPAWSFAEWLDAYAVDTVEALGRDLVRFGAGQTLEPADGVRIVEQRPDPQLPEPFAPASSRTAVAKVERDGVTWFVLARELEGERDYVATPRSEKTGDDLDSFLQLATERYSGQGGAGVK
ncbi:hypothetical protein I601_0930 [Nocardioides dokdonensis FR1436]|uniref:Uncharacterized protein n=1 Tax=Nocardioides dokdonensis FR1436 TaxID=1300347 RepID=A0A1A9GIC2_9ACTN|nr:hypothetical protein [Nocardioides dokdonensis]ANH37373.1 hypothetical protein I601_0930 [Nocardioides dokdonensis FR1436]